MTTTSLPDAPAPGRSTVERIIDRIRDPLKRRLTQVEIALFLFARVREQGYFEQGITNRQLSTILAAQGLELKPSHVRSLVLQLRNGGTIEETSPLRIDGRGLKRHRITPAGMDYVKYRL